LSLTGPFPTHSFKLLASSDGFFPTDRPLFFSDFLIERGAELVGSAANLTVKSAELSSYFGKTTRAENNQT
jgi:hypothetical protein